MPVAWRGQHAGRSHRKFRSVGTPRENPKDVLVVSAGTCGDVGLGGELQQALATSLGGCGGSGPLVTTPPGAQSGVCAPAEMRYGG